MKVVFTPSGNVSPWISGRHAPNTSAFTLIGNPKPNVQKIGSIRWQLQSPSVLQPYIVQNRHTPGRYFGQYERCGTGPCHCSQSSVAGISQLFFSSSSLSM